LSDATRADLPKERRALGRRDGDDQPCRQQNKEQNESCCQQRGGPKPAFHPMQYPFVARPKNHNQKCRQEKWHEKTSHDLIEKDADNHNG
jgi:hypothetical protein